MDPRPEILTSGRDSPFVDRTLLRGQPRFPGPEASTLRASTGRPVPELAGVTNRQPAVLLFLSNRDWLTADRTGHDGADGTDRVLGLLEERRIF